MQKQLLYLLVPLTVSLSIYKHYGNTQLLLTCLATQALLLVSLAATREWRRLQWYKTRLAYKVFRGVKSRTGVILADEVPGRYRFELMLNESTDEQAFANALKSLTESMEDRIMVEQLLSDHGAPQEAEQ